MGKDILRVRKGLLWDSLINTGKKPPLHIITYSLLTSSFAFSTPGLFLIIPTSEYGILPLQAAPTHLNFGFPLVASQAADDVSPDAYWKSVLPNAPMPKAVKDILHNGQSVSSSYGPVKVIRKYYIYGYQATEAQIHDPRNVAVFFLEKDLKRGTKKYLYFPETTNAATTLLPRQVADKIPFSSEKMSEILDQFSVKHDSEAAEAMKETIKVCEEPAIKGEEKYCATSLEAMVDFTTSKLGKSVQAISTEVEKETNKVREYRVSGVKKMGGEKSVVCHKVNYPYAVFYCHKITATKAYVVSLVGLGGTKAKAVAVCHTDTSGWNPKTLALQVLKVKPGTVPVCHFLFGNQVLWVQN